MHGAGRAGLCVAALAALLLALPPLVASAEPDAERETKKAELKRLRDRIDALRGDLAKVRGEHDTLRDELRSSEQRIASLARNLKQLDEQLREQGRKLAGLRDEQRTLTRQVADQRRHLGGQVRAAYAIGRQEQLKILLNQEDPARLGRMLTYYDYLNRARTERIAALLVTLDRLAVVERAIADETRTLDGLRDRQLAEKANLEEGRRSREQVLAKLRKELASKDRRLKRMLADEQELKALIEALAQALSDIPADLGGGEPFGKLRGRLRWPTDGKLLVSYGAPRSVGDLRWQGVLIGGREGQAVRAVSHGRIAFADWLRGYGLIVIIDHDDGYMSLYGHNQAAYKEVGDWVQAGEVIATVGNTGGQERAGLYFEIRHNGRPTDPIRWCRR